LSAILANNKSATELAVRIQLEIDASANTTESLFVKVLRNATKAIKIKADILVRLFSFHFSYL